MSINPGATTFPAASIVRWRAAAERLPIAAILPSRIPISPEYHGEPVPSMMWPFVMTISNACGVCAHSNPQARTIVNASVIGIRTAKMEGIVSPRYFRGPDFTAAAIAPRTHHAAKAAHSYLVKWPGIVGMIFIKARAIATNKPKIATVASPADDLMTSGFHPPNARYDAHAAAHPTAQATEPTSVTGTRMASPSSMQRAVAVPTPRTATEGV